MSYKDHPAEASAVPCYDCWEDFVPGTEPGQTPAVVITHDQGDVVVHRLWKENEYLVWIICDEHPWSASSAALRPYMEPKEA